MSLEGVTDAVAAVVAATPGMRAVYSSTGSGVAYEGVLPIIDDIAVTPSALVRHDGFTLAPGSFEKWLHRIAVDIYFEGADPGTAEKEMLPMVTRIVVQFRSYVGLSDALSAAGIVVAVVQEGGPSMPVSVNQKPYEVYPLTVGVTEAGPQQYKLTPS